MWELIVKWDSGDKTVYSYETRDEAEQAGDRMEMALGNQICWYGVRPQVKRREGSNK